MVSQVAAGDLKSNRMPHTMQRDRSLRIEDQAAYAKPLYENEFWT